MAQRKPLLEIPMNASIVRDGRLFYDDEYQVSLKGKSHLCILWL